MEATHTPGPWKAQMHNDQFRAIEITTETWETPIALIHNAALPQDEPGDVATVWEQVQATALLIAKAPEMADELAHLRKDKAELLEKIDLARTQIRGGWVDLAIRTLEAAIKATQ